jgi:hypothetical protein
MNRIITSNIGSSLDRLARAESSSQHDQQRACHRREPQIRPVKTPNRLRRETATERQFTDARRQTTKLGAGRMR